MHREISHVGTFESEERFSLYLLTGLLGLLILADLWPYIAAYLDTWGLSLPTWSNEVRGYRIALVAAVLGTARVLYNSLDALLQGRVGADLALAIAAVAAILVPKPLVAAEIVFVGLLGECLESITFERTQRALRQLIELTPRRCWRLRDGAEERVFTHELRVGDVVVVKPGGRIPADGVVVEGRSSIDIGALTGEGLPVDRGPGDEVLAGALNQYGALTIEARRVAEQTVVGRVLELTSRALKDKAPLERTADRLARYFLPTVLALAALTFLVAFALSSRLPFWSAVRAAVNPTLSVLVVACPCALILATPAAVIAALGRLAGTGILIKGGSALERLATVDRFCFDKTGTLTEGKLELGEVVAVGDVSAEDLLALAASAEARSEHPLARLVLQAATERGLEAQPVEEFQAHPGAGVRARVAGADVLVGNRRLLEEQGIDLSPEVLAALDLLDARGQTVLLVARDGRVLGLLGARDRVRAEAVAVLNELRALGITRLAMLTGDRTAVARTVAGELGLSEYHAELLPDQKADFVRAWQEAPANVAMVGDGINDAPALAQARVGLAVGGSGADMAAEAGDIVLMLTPGAAGPLRHLPLLLRLSRETVRVIRQNILFFAFVVNGLGILLTAWLWALFAPPGWGEHGPLAAILYHQLGSLAVLLNSMRLLWFEKGSTAWRTKARAVEGWLERRLDLDAALHWAAHHWRLVGLVKSAILLLIVAASGFTVIKADEVGVVRRFGRPFSEPLGPGLYWLWPWPVDRLDRVRPQRVETVALGFRLTPGRRTLAGGRPWSAAHGADGLVRVPEEAVLITGDGNLLEVQASVRYRAADPMAFLFAARDVPELLRNATEATVRELVAGRPMSSLLTTRRADLGAEALKRLRARLSEVAPDGLGIVVEGLSLHDLHPPMEVVRAYHDVTRAMEERDRKVNEAHAQRTAALREAEARKQQTIREAEADHYVRLRLARARRAEFLARYEARSRLPWSRELQLLGDAFADLYSDTTPEDAARRYRQRRGAELAAQEVLTDFRLYWERLVAALEGRPKVFLDTEKLPGRRSLWLLPFEPPAPPPLISPADRPRRRDPEP